MNDTPDPRATDPDERRFALSVWPQTPARAWQARVSAAGASEAAEPLRFDRPVDLVLYLTELSHSPDWQPRGLR